ncbi:exonuclease SbcCD subunit D [Methanolobus sp. ZRKC2]|uniref:metallophosphoesterase n=1 Tax=Methanolobus sp. ZRKC2 TaxID=3125783 RepID=UPI0032552C00
MDEIRIIHTADTHLGYRQYQSEVRRQDFMDAFSRVIDDAIEMKADAVVHAGDLFDSRNPTLDDILGAMELFSRLKNAGIPLLAIVGNHESKQSTQWLDLYGSMGLVIRLGATPYRLGNVAIYGIDCVSKSRIPLFDYSVFDGTVTDAQHNLLVMHQLMKPFPFGEWDVHEVIGSLPFDVNAVLLGDNHKHEIIKVDDAWVTYCGSTERNSTSEREPRSYNIITVNEEGVDISRRIIPTRDFVFIPVHLEGDADAYTEIFSAIKEHDIEDKITFVNISGDPTAKVTFSEIEKFLLSRNALVPGIKDLRTGEVSLDDARMHVSFADPDDAVKEEIRKMHLTEGGLLIDEIVRDSKVVKTKVDAEVEKRIGELIDNTDFSESVVIRSVGRDEFQMSDGQSGEVSIPAVNVDVDAIPAENTEVMSEIYRDESVTCTESSTPAEGEVVSQEESHHEEDTLNSESEDETSVKSTTDHEVTKDETPSDESSSSKEEIDHKPRQYNLGDYL